MQVKVLAPDGTTQIAPTATNYHDQLARVIVSDSEGFDGSPVRVETKYDALGRVEKKSRPYFVSGGTPKWTTYTYDDLGRIVSETGPDSATTTRTYSGLTTSVTNALSQTSTSTKNSQGQVVEVKDTQSNVTTYQYEPFGNLTKVTDAAGNVTTYAYDTRGRKISSSDPDMGTTTYTYDVLDKPKTQTNAASEVTTVSYDLLGRVTQRVEPGLTSTWTWDTAANGIGKLATAATDSGYLRTHTYDGLGRPDRVQLTIGGNTYATTSAYDSASRVSKVTYPSGFAVTYSYNPTGYQFKLADAATAEVLWRADARDAELHLTQQTAGNGVVTYQAFDANTGQLTDITAGETGKVHRQTYTYDLLGKLLTRSDANTSLSESFEYDTLNRLTKSTVSLSPTPWVQTIAYNAIGNITFKSDVGTYTYPAAGQPKPHGVTSITGGTINTTFTYDAKGNMISGNGLTVAYTSYNKTATITRGTTSISFEHDTEHQRFSQMGPSGTTLYLAGGGVLAERFAGLGGGGVQWTNYLIIGGRLVGVFIQKADETTATRYFHTDHLGSISVITNEAGGVVERLSFDAWGKRRHPDGSPDPAGAITSEASRGFTGHEQLDSVGLIHMNGRVYDPLLARFGTPDPMTEDPFSTQGWNRYSYVGNSPVNFADPSGYCFMGCFWQPTFRAIGNFFRQNWAAIVQVAATALLCSGPWAPVCAGVISAAVTGVTSGDLGMALRAGVTAFITATAFQVVGKMTAGNLAAKIAAHAGVGCVSAMMSGGRCGAGAASAAVSAAGSPFVPDDLFGGTVASAVLGGLGSVAGGGNFANGAVTAAFGYLFNYRSNRWLRATVPGQVAWDDAVTAVEEGRYGAAVFSTGIMVGEQVLFVLSFGTTRVGLAAGEMAAETYSAIGSTGAIGERALAALGGESQVYFNTTLGGRYVDQLVNGLAHEAKVGYASLTDDITLQILKDVELIQSGQIQGAVWHFFRSPVTQQIGPSAPLANFLRQNGIGVVIH